MQLKKKIKLSFLLIVILLRIYNKIELLRKTLEEKDKKISLLEVNITTLETAFTGKLTTIEKHVTEKGNKFKCGQCDYATTSEAGLKSHTSKKHKKGKVNAEIGFPKKCTLCDEIFKTTKKRRFT